MRHLNLESLNLRDYRCFDAINISFHPRLTVLVAANGAGKTSILDAIAVAFGPYVGAFDEATGKHFEPDDIRQVRVRETATHEMEYAAIEKVYKSVHRSLPAPSRPVDRARI